MSTLLTGLLFLVVFTLLVSTIVRWTVPTGDESMFGRGVIRVEVLNGCGESGVAERVTGWLRAQGFDIVYFGNAESFDYEETLLLDRSGRPEFVREVAAVLDGGRIERRFDGLLLLDVTVVVGRDWRTLRLREREETGWAAAGRWLRERFEAWLVL